MKKIKDHLKKTEFGTQQNVGYLLKILKKTPLFFIRIGIIAVLTIIIAIPFILLDSSLEFFFLDLKFSFTTHIINRNVDISDTIAVILMDSYSEEKLGMKDPLDWRKKHPRLIEVLSASGAALIVFDAEFRDPGPYNDEELATAFQRAGNVITGELTPGATLPLFREHISGVGDLNFSCFHSIPRKTGPNNFMKSLSLIVTDRFLKGLPEEKAGTYITPEQFAILKEQGYFWIDYAYPLHHYPAVSYNDVIESNYIPSFKDKIIIIGHYSDVNYYPHVKEKEYAGLYGHAYATENILLNNYLRKAPAAVNFIILIICFILTQGFYEIKRGKMKPVFFFLYSLLFLIIIFLLESLIQSTFFVWLHFTSIFFMVCITSFVHTLYTKIVINRQLKEIESYKEQISVYESRQDKITDAIMEDIRGKIKKLRTCLHVIKRESVDNTRLKKYIHLTSQNCDGVQFLFSLLKGDITLSPSPVDCTKIRKIIKELFEIPALQANGIHLNISPLPGNFILHADFQVLSSLITYIFKKILDNAQTQSTIHMNISTPGDENRISFIYTGSMYPDNNLLFNRELIKKMNGNIYCTRNNSSIEVILAFPAHGYP